MHSLALLAFLLVALATLVAADTHAHRANHRGIHRRHHARAQDAAPDASHRRRRRSCAATPSSSASASAPTATELSASASSAVSTGTASVGTSSTEAPSSTFVASSSSAAAPATSSAAPAPSSSTDSDSDSRRTSSKAPAASSAKASPAAAAPTAQSLAAGSSLLASLFPVSDAVNAWSTASSAAGRSTALTLSDSTLRATRILGGASHDYVQFAGKRAMEAVYPKGAYNFQHEPRGGFSMYAYGPESVDLTTAREATVGYSVWFEEGFEFNMGGKIPGFWGGDSDEGSISCSGGARSDKCFSSRLMWRTPKEAGGPAAGELYTYLPPSAAANEKLCSVPPYSDCNPTYGASVGRDAFQIRSGRWETLTQRVRLNDVGRANGEIEVFVNGKSVISVGGLVIRTSDAGRIRGVMIQTFFGGSKPEWGSPKTQRAYFADFSVAITEKL